ncbi:type I restriction enzyme, S subunit [Nitrosomonas sp. Nm51]|uniref:restriction endonuclease subunit S n=1 Tax=Nitrosomonas sp. Nm51 TaxID=133720 RepID=UPI0008CD6F6E|nr:restriction endonuclease subunit S [Nitrosomonas sp. Nm51]SER30486.1 type I restriction enzyme, S subunit [Nitrosomonas sp. Nm51]
MNVPEGWDIKTVQEIAEVTSGGTPSRKKPSYWNGTVPWIRTTEVQNCVLYETDVQEYISEEGLKNSSAKLVPKNTILLAMIGQGKTRGQVALLKFKATTNQNCAAIIFDENQEPEFYYNFLLAQYKNIRNFSNSAGQSNLSGALVKSIRVTVPPLPEQKKIARILSTWDRAIEVTEKLLNNSQQQKKALMQQLLTGKKRLPGFSGEWETKTLREIGEIKSAGVDKKIIDGEKPVRLLNFTDVFNRSFIYSHQLNHWVTAPESKISGCDVRIGDVFFTPSSETRDEAGIPAVAAENIDQCCYSYHVVRLRFTEKWDLNFKAYVFTTSQFRRQAYMLADGSGQRYVISQENFRKIQVTFPNYDEQIAIGKILKAAESEIEILEKKLSCLRQEKKALMQQLLTGKRRVQIN